MTSTFKNSTMASTKANKSVLRSTTAHNSSIMTSDGTSFDMKMYEEASLRSKRQSMNFHRNSAASTTDKSAY